MGDTVWDDYDQQGFYCELSGPPGGTRPETRELRRRLDRLGPGDLQRRSEEARIEMYNAGITFTVYSEAGFIDRVFPVDIVPRVITAPEWAWIERGVRQRVVATNLFLDDIYHDRRCIADGVIPEELVIGNRHFRPQMQGIDLPFKSYVTIAGIDLVRGTDGVFRVLEDNGRTPSGVSYVVENRHLMQRAFSDIMKDVPVRPVDDYGNRLHDAMLEIAPDAVADPQVVLLSPGVYNSAYFEHIFLAREMGVPLVEGRDLVVEGDHVYMKTTAGLSPVCAIYRRIDDDFLDPEAFNPDSLLGVPGLMRVYARGNVALANAIGTGVADDKAVYCYMPRLIEYYLGEKPVLPNVETHICGEPDGLEYTLDNMDRLVIKPVGESGGYGITIGPECTADMLEVQRRKIVADPANFISQPVVALSVSPTLIGGALEPRHVDLRPFAITGRDTWVLPGGLTRVALPRGSLVVNSSQGGGSKDTWVLG